MTTDAPVAGGRGGPQAHLVVAGVRDEVIDMLVGHAGEIRGRHYVNPASRFEAMRAAVAQIPDVDWRAETAATNVVPFSFLTRGLPDLSATDGDDGSARQLTSPAPPQSRG